MTQNWYYRNHEKTSGPFSTVEINNLAAAGLVHPEDLVWIEDGNSSDAMAARGAELFSLASKPSRPPNGLPTLPARKSLARAWSFCG